MPLDAGGGSGRRPSRNVLGGTLENCSLKPMTGFFRNGCCDTSAEDVGSHTVCIVATAEFLAFSKSRGKFLTIVYFACLGGGYIMVEVGLIARQSSRK